MRNYRDFRNNFAAGVISKEFLARAREEVTGVALSRGDNAFITDAGTVMRRCGTVRKFRAGQPGRVVSFSFKSIGLRHLIFYNGGVLIYEDDGTLEATLAGPWSTSELYTMAIETERDRVIICHTAFHPQEMVISGTWSIANFAFRVDAGGRKASPFVGSGQLGLETVTMQPSGYSGSVSVVFSSNVLVAGHVGVRFMYMGSQLQITAVSDGQNGTATVIDQLYPTVRVGVTSATGYKVGDLVEGDITNVRGQVRAVNVGGATVDIVLTEGYSVFSAPGADSLGEKLIGPEVSEEITSVTTLGTPGATNIWFEELISAPRGYPATCAMHRTRLVFAGFQIAPSMIVASALGEFDDFDLGGGSARDAIQEFMGEDPNAQILHLVSTDQLVILTDRGCWYVPEGNGRLFTPEGIGFDPISPDAASLTPPLWTPEGVVFIDKEERVLLLSLTGTQRGPYSVTDLTNLGRHLVSAPKQLAYSAGIGGRQERVIAVLNGDGGAAIFTYRRGADQAGWLPWSRGDGGTYLSFSAFNGELYCLGVSDDLRNFERFDFTAVMDSEVAGDSTAYVSETFDLLLNSHVVGTASTNGSGVLDDLGTLEAVDKLGHDFPVAISPAPMVISQAGRQRRRNARTYVDTIDTGLFHLNGKQCAAYDRQSDIELPPLVVDREYRGSQLGSSIDKTILIEQKTGQGAPFHARSMTMEVRAR